MPDEKIADLIERVERASGPDREIDGEAWKLFVEKPGDVWSDEFGVWHLQDPNDTIAWEPPPYLTSSLDAVLSLVERVRPGWGWQVNGGSLAKVATLMDDDSWSVPFEGAAATPPLAVLSALLRSIQAT